MRTLTTTLSVVIVALAVQSAGAQPTGSTRYHLGLLPRHHWYYHPYHASTAWESWQRGNAAVIHSQGYYNYMTAAARGLHADAYRKEIYNREQAIQSYFTMREANRQFRAAERGPRPDGQTAARLAKQAAPKRPAADQLSVTTGKVSWPVLLKAEKYSDLRSEVQAIFSKRAESGSIDAEEYGQVKQATRAMLAELKKDVRQVDPMDYTTARRFLESLTYEAQFPLI